MITEPQQREKTLKTSFHKGLFGCCMTGFTQEYFTPFLLFVGASAVHIGILNSMANLFSSFVQLASADIARFMGSRKKAIGLITLVQSFMLALITIFAFSHSSQYWLLIVLAVLFTSFGSLFHPIWTSFLSDLVDVQKRGAYFGWRGRNLGLVTVGAMALAGSIIHYMEKVDTALGFTIIFMVALLCRLASLYFLQKMHEPLLQYKKEDQFSFFQFFARIKESNFVKFVLFVSLMNFSVNLAAPFFAVLMLRDLSFNYFLYTAVIIAAPLTLYLSIERWGHHADHTGNLRVIRLTSRLIAIVPLLWIINRTPVYLVFVEMFSGFLWAGFNLCTVNFIFDAASPEKRTRCIAYFSVVNGLALAVGAFIGGFLIDKLPPLLGYQILTLFLVSSLFRLAVSFGLIKMVKEVRKAASVRSADIFFSMIGMKPVLGVDRRRTMRM